MQTRTHVDAQATPYTQGIPEAERGRLRVAARGDPAALRAPPREGPEALNCSHRHTRCKSTLLAHASNLAWLHTAAHEDCPTLTHSRTHPATTIRALLTPRAMRSSTGQPILLAAAMQTMRIIDLGLHRSGSRPAASCTDMIRCLPALPASSHLSRAS